MSVETDKDKVELLKELGDDMFHCGGDKSRVSDYDTLSYCIGSVGYEKVEELEKLEDYKEFCFVEDYPYRYGTYSGVYNLHTGEFEEFYCEGDSSPCGGPDFSGFVVSDHCYQLLVKELVV